MKTELLRNPLPEDVLSNKRRANRVSKFKALAEQLRELRTNKTAGYKAKAAVEQILPYIALRLKLLEREMEYAVLLGRAKRFRGYTFGKSNSSHTFARIARSLVEEDFRNVLRANNEKVRKLIGKIAADALTIDELLTDTGLEIHEDIRPHSCLPSSVAGKDKGSKSSEHPADNGPRHPNSGPPDSSPSDPLKASDAADGSSTTKPPIPEGAAYRRATQVHQTLHDLDSICNEGWERPTQLQRWVEKNTKSPLAKLFRRNPDEVRRICSKIDGHINERLAIDVVSQSERIEFKTVRRYWNKYRHLFDN